MGILIHITLAIILFFLIRSVGNATKRLEYSSMSDAFTNSNYFGYNATLRIFGPIVFIILISIIGYKYCPSIVHNIWLITVYYSIIVYGVVWFLGRTKFMNINYFLLYSLSSILLSILIYNYVISRGLVYILPDFNGLKSEIWLLIILFFYKVFENLGNGDISNIKKRENELDDYIKVNYNNFSKKYGRLITGDMLFKKLFYSIMIFENYNRPIYIRMIEKVYYYMLSLIKKKIRISSGIMQVKNVKFLSDRDSIKEAINILLPIYKETLSKLKKTKTSKKSYEGFSEITNKLIHVYSTDYKYENEVTHIYYRLCDIIK